MLGGFFRPFAEQGFRVFGMDRRGFGKSQGTRGDPGSHLVEDYAQFIGRVVETFELHGAKKYLFGQSQGALLVSHLAVEMENYFDGIILTAPWYANHPKLHVNKTNRFLLKIV